MSGSVARPDATTARLRPALRLLRSLVGGIGGGRARFGLAVLLAALASGASVALMGVSGWLLSRAAEHPPVLYLEAAAVGVRFFGILRGVARYAERLVSHRLALDVQGALRLASYDRLSRTTLLGGRRGDLLARLVVDVDAVLDLVARVVVPCCAAGLVATATSLALALFSPAQAAVLFATSLVAGVLLPWLVGRLGRAADEQVVVARADLAVSLDVLAHGATDLAAYGLADDALARHDQVQQRLAAAERRSAWVRGLVEGGQLVATGVAVASALWIGSHEVAAGHLLGRDLAVLVLTPLALHEALGTLAAAAQAATRSAAALGRVQAVLDEPLVGRGDRPEAPPTRHPRLVLTDVSVGWPGAAPLATGLSFTVGPGDRVAVTGPSGVGKTTLAATVMGLLPPQAGTVEASGEVVHLAQDAHLFATSIAENVRIGARDATDDEVVAALRTAGLDLDPSRVVGEQGATLSGGEARRVALARVLVGGRGTGRVFVLDEPTEHLDGETAQVLVRDLWRAVGDSPVLVVTHDPLLVADCTHVVDITPAVGAPAR